MKGIDAELAKKREGELVSSEEESCDRVEKEILILDNITFAVPSDDDKEYLSNCLVDCGGVCSPENGNYISKKSIIAGVEQQYVLYRERFFKLHSVLWLINSSEWIEDFENIRVELSEFDIEYIIPKSFDTGVFTYSKELLLEMFECDEDGFFWFYQDDRSAAWNTLMTGTNAYKVVNGRAYVDIFGVIYRAEDVLTVLYDLPDSARDSLIECNVDDTGIRDWLNGNRNIVLLSSESEFVENYSVIEDDGLTSSKYGRNLVLSCFYCGDNSSITRDHVIPVSYRSGGRSYDRRDTVPCCRECNSILSNKPFFVVEDRASYLAERLAKKYKRVIESFPYTKDEIERMEFGERLESMLNANANHRCYIVSRIDHCHKVAGSLYDEKDVSHLRGVTTEAKRVAYKLIEEFVQRRDIPKDQYIKEKSKELNESESDLKKILNGTLHPDVAIQFKYDYRYPFDLSVYKIRDMLIKNSIFK